MAKEKYIANYQPYYPQAPIDKGYPDSYGRVLLQDPMELYRVLIIIGIVR